MLSNNSSVDYEWNKFYDRFSTTRLLIFQLYVWYSADCRVSRELAFSKNKFCTGVYLEGGMLLAPHKGFWVNFISCKDDDIDEKKAAIYDQDSPFLPA